MHKPEGTEHDTSHLVMQSYLQPLSTKHFWLLELCSSVAQFLVNLIMKKSTVSVSNL